jgi:hypothetical protein
MNTGMARLRGSKGGAILVICIGNYVADVSDGSEIQSYYPDIRHIPL